MTRTARAPSSRPRASGQILVLMALLSTTLVILFGMVVGVGHLIQARMNLQNAVDLAAMSGASWQARYMNHLALVNYRLRQNYKFQLYDFYVTASRFNKGLMNQVRGGGILDKVPKEATSFGICQQSFGFDPNFSGFGESSQGSPLATDTDYCQNVVGSGGVGLTIPEIKPSPVPNLNPILIAANLAVINLSERLRRLCSEASGQNRVYFNMMTKALAARQKFQVQQMIKVIDEFDRAFSTGALLESNRVGDATIRRTFNDNLIAANLSGRGLELRWLAPNQSRAFRVGSISDLSSKIFGRGSAGDQFAQYFQRQRVTFTFPYVDFGANCSVTVKQATASGDPTIVGIGRARVNSGASDNPVKVPIFTALQASVTPALLFWPRGLTPTLVAVAAAKPFGSRIGPPLELTNLEISGVRNLREENQTQVAQGNMSFYPGDVEGAGGGGLPGIGHKVILNYLFQALDPPSNGPNAGVRTRRPSISNRATSGPCNVQGNLPFTCLALAPTLYEGLFWNAYQFPPQTMGNPLSRATFPFEINSLQVADGGAYNLPDRQAGGGGGLAGWHATAFIGRSSQFRLGGKPVFFADTVSALSSWSPDHEYDASSVRPAVGASGGTQGEGRQGYQIKLVSLAQVCAEMQQGGVVPIQDPLRKFCVARSPDQVFH